MKRSRSASWSSSVRSSVVRSTFDRSVPVWITTAVTLVLLMILPLGWLSWVSVSSEQGTTFANYVQGFGDPHLQKALWNTINPAFLVGAASLAVWVARSW